MANPREPILLIDDLRGGLNATTSPLALQENECSVATNVEWLNLNKMPQKRAGTATVSLASWSPTTASYALLEFVPRAGATAAELWAFDISTPSTIGRLAGGTTWATVTPSPADVPLAAYNLLAMGASFNNKFFLAYTTATDRMHVWDGTTLRRMGMATAGVPTVANTGAGAYAATLRYYKVSFTEVVGSAVVRRGELSSAVSFTPSGAGTAARVTKPSNPGEGETHWEVWGSANGSSYYKLQTLTVSGFSTWDDTTAPSTYSTAGVLAPAAGEYQAIGAVRLLAVADNRLFLSGYPASAFSAYVWFTPVYGETGEGDDERVPPDHYVEVDRGVGGDITGLATLFGSVFVFKYESFYQLIRTGDNAAPYTVSQVSNSIGAVNQRTIVQAEDEDGSPCLYWVSRQGVYRYGRRGIEYISGALAGIWDTGWLDYLYLAHAVYHAAKKQVWVWVKPLDTTNTLFVYHIRTGAWWRYSGTLTTAWCSAMFSATPGATMSRDRKPYAAVGQGIVKADTGTTDVTDGAYQALVKTKAFLLAGPMTNQGITEAQLYAKALSNQSLTLTLDRDFGAETRTTTASLTPAGSETRVLRKFEDAAMTSAQAIQLQIGDASAVDSGAWELDAVAIRFRGEQVR